MHTLSRTEQRNRNESREMLSLQLEAHLRNLSREILAGDSSKLPEFQEFVQYAPTEMKARIDDLILSL